MKYLFSPRWSDRLVYVNFQHYYVHPTVICVSTCTNQVWKRHHFLWIHFNLTNPNLSFLFCFFFPPSSIYNSVTQVTNNNVYNDNTDSTTARRANVANVVAIFALMIGLLALFVAVFIYWKSGLAALLRSREVGGTGRTLSTNQQQWVSPLINAPDE